MTPEQLDYNSDYCRYGVCEPHENHAPWCTEYTKEEIERVQLRKLMNKQLANSRRLTCLPSEAVADLMRKVKGE